MRRLLFGSTEDKCCFECGMMIPWSARTLDRNIASQYYYRLLQSQNKQVVKDEMEQITAPYQHDKLEFIKNLL